MTVRLTVRKGDLTTATYDAVVVNMFQDVKRLSQPTNAIDRALEGAIRHAVDLGDFSGKTGQKLVLHPRGKLSADRVIVVGLGKRTSFDLDGVREAAATAARFARSLRLKRIATIVHGAESPGLDAEAAAQAVAEGIIMGLFRFDEYRPGDDPDRPPDHLVRVDIIEPDAKSLPAIRRGIRRGTILAEGVNLARTLTMRPSNAKSPARMAQIARQQGNAAGLQVTVLTPAAIKRLGMGLLVGVGRGAEPARQPRLVVLEHRGRGAKTIALVGKGITFDSGGINIKPSKGLEMMKYDMAGSATVLGAMVAAARLRVPNRVIGIMALAENMPSGTATRPGDVLTAYDGTTVEIGNTDAEGRLVLGDALAYTIDRFNPDIILDVATLTGAVKVALGDITTGVLGNDDALIETLRKVGRGTGENLWPLPLTPEYEKQVRSHVATIKNVGSGGAGTIAGAAFLKHFVDQSKKARWAHLDIAGTAWTDGGRAELRRAYLPNGATGVAVRLFAEFLRVAA